MASELRQRAAGQKEEGEIWTPSIKLGTGADAVSLADGEHPSGKEGHGRLMQIARGALFAVYFFSSLAAIHVAQFAGVPLYWINRDFYYSYMAVTKQLFGLVVTTMTHWWSPTTVRISGDASVADQIKKRPDGLVEFGFPERMVMIANHQIYTDWLYLWWVGYANDPQMHGHLFIILKESLKYVPIIGPGMMFFGFIFMSRKMAVDQPRMAHRLGKLRSQHISPQGKKYFDPMWLLLFPEGTNASGNGRVKSAKWAEKIGVKDMQHLLLPRSTGLFFCLQELKGTVDYIYDCTVAYEGIPRGRFGEDYFGLVSTYFGGRPPKSVNFHWRRFRIDDIPLSDAAEFEVWLRERWYEKDDFMEQYTSTGRFPATPATVDKKRSDDGFIETEVRTAHWYEILQVFVPAGLAAFLLNFLLRIWTSFVRLFSRS